MDSSYFYAYSHLAFSYTLRGSNKEALQYADKTLTFVGGIKKDPMTTCLVGWVYAKSGRKDAAEELLKQMEALYKQTYVDPIHIAFIYNGLGEKEKAFEYLFKAYEMHSGQIIYLNAFGDSYFKDIRSDPRFKDLLKKIGFKV